VGLALQDTGKSEVHFGGYIKTFGLNYAEVIKEG
jgi:hypothetical protein